MKIRASIHARRLFIKNCLAKTILLYDGSEKLVHSQMDGESVKFSSE